MPEEIQWPVRSQEMKNNHMDSTFWDDFVFRDDDIVIGTWAKSGTTWVQQIVSQLIFQGVEGLPVADMSPWIDLRAPPREVKMPEVEAQEHRRFVKTHLPVDALLYSPKAKYIYIARDGRDVVWSLFNHHHNANDVWYDIMNNTPGRVGPPIEKPGDDIVEYFREWLDKDGFPFPWSFFGNIKSWWDIRHLPNMKLIHFEQLKRDMEGEIRDIAQFLDIEIDEEKWPLIVKHCSFDYMKKNATDSTPLGGVWIEGGAETFVNKGVNGRWRDILPKELSDRYEQTAIERLGPVCAEWLKTGRLPAN